MGKKLVIVESPAKAKTINKILGKDFVVLSSVGHVRDLPVKELGVDVEKGFAPKYVIVKGKQKIITELKAAAAEADAVYLAPDPDREGEAIAWHLHQVLSASKKTNGTPFHRVQYNEVTPQAVRAAFEQPGKIDMARVDAQQARRLLDRIVGYTVSPVLWRRIRRGLSAGRVQSVALRLVCEREAEIREFVPEAFWIMGALVRKLIVPLDPFRLRLLRVDDKKAEIKSEADAEAIRKDLDGRELRVTKVATKDVRKRPYPPHITSTLQQAGSSRYRFSPKRTMSIAQKLYEGMDVGDGAGPVGLITYMRTDSFAISKDAQDGCRQFLVEQFGKDYVPEKPNVYKSRASAQEAHEAIRPTDTTRTPDSLAKKLDPAQLKVYRLIWERFVASQMTPAVIGQRTATVDATAAEDGGRSYLFQATASEVKFPGYMKVSGIEKPEGKKQSEDEKPKEDKGEKPLPVVAEGEKLQCLEWLSDRKETKPPPRYSEASLVRALEKNGVGRPSTYAQIISTLEHREYVTQEKRMLTPTDLGMQVSAFLVESLGMLFDVTFTASMEESLDDIERGQVEWTAMLGTFYESFRGWVDAIKMPEADVVLLAKTLELLKGVKEWAPEFKRGKRTYSDERFVASIHKQIDTGKRPVSERQMEALLRIACHYKDQVDGVEAFLVESGHKELLERSDLKPPKDTTITKLDLMSRIELDESAKSFVDSLRSRVEAGRCLSPAQAKALNNIVLSHASAIDGFDAIKDTLELENSEVAEDHESAPLIEALSGVTEWKPPVQRGKRTFDDKAFYESLQQQFGRKGFLSFKQRAALKRMVTRYRDVVPNYEALAEQLGLGKKGGKAKQETVGDEKET